MTDIENNKENVPVDTQKLLRVLIILNVVVSLGLLYICKGELTDNSFWFLVVYSVLGVLVLIVQAMKWEKLLYFVHDEIYPKMILASLFFNNHYMIWWNTTILLILVSSWLWTNLLCVWKLPLGKPSMFSRNESCRWLISSNL